MAGLPRMWRAAAMVLLVAPLWALARDGAVEPETVLVVPWGSGGQMLSRRGGDESNPEGPMSFAVGQQGRILVLDQASGRVAEFGMDGALVREARLPATTFADLEVTALGEVVLLDRLVRQSILVLDRDLGRRAEYPVSSPRIPEGGAVTAMLARADGVWLEVAHERSVKVLGPDLAPCEQVQTRGRPMRDGIAAGFVAAELDGAGGVYVEVGRPGGGTVKNRVLPDRRTTRIAWLDDASGRVVVMFEVGSWDRGEETPELRGAVLDQDLSVVAWLRTRWPATELEQFREFLVRPDGSVWQMAFFASGVVFNRWVRP